MHLSVLYILAFGMGCLLFVETISSRELQVRIIDP